MARQAPPSIGCAGAWCKQQTSDREASLIVVISSTIRPISLNRVDGVRRTTLAKRTTTFVDARNSRLKGHPSIDITGPNSLDPSWRRLTPGALPDTSKDEQPKGACNGSVAAWDHSH